MQISNNGLSLIKSFESCKLHAYQDQRGIWTIGWGHTEDVRFGESCSQGFADLLFKNDTDKISSRVGTLIKVFVNQNQFDACCSFAYNVGANAFSLSTLLRDINARNFHHAADQFLLWVNVNGKYSEGLAFRRQAEKALFVS